MGWLFMKSLRGHPGPRQYLDAQFTYKTPDATSKVLRSALVGMRTYYAAVEHVPHTGAAPEVWALICPVQYNPRARYGDILGYRPMQESTGACECGCPTPILDLLTPTVNKDALQWRQRCRDAATARRRITAKPTPRAGQVIVLAEPMCFSDGRSFDCLEVVTDPRSNRTVLFRAPGSDSVYRIPNVKNRSYRLIDPQAD